MNDLTLGLIAALAVTVGFIGGYVVGHYEALRCGCYPLSQHFVRRWLGMSLTVKESKQLNHKEQPCTAN